MRRDLAERLLDYGASIIKLAGILPKTPECWRLGDQLLRCSISVGAHYEEAQGAESRNDFVHKLQMALKEVRESNYWLRLMAQAETVPPGQLTQLLDESIQLRAILSKAVATAKGTAK
jgi:four helix bundle protein